GTSAVLTPSKAGEVVSGNVSFGSSSTFAPFLTGESGSVTLFNFNNAVNYPFSTPPNNPVNGELPSPYGALFNWFGNVPQDGTGPVLLGGAATNGFGFDYFFGANNHPKPNSPGVFVLDPTNISGKTQLKVVMKALPSNVTPVIALGLFDVRGNANLWRIPSSALNTSPYTTVTVSLRARSI